MCINLIKNNLLLLLVTVLACNGKKPKEKEVVVKSKKPNIIWLMAEDISTDLACYGLPNVKTPNLDGMARKGVRFDNAFVTNPICSPSRSAMMLGAHQVKTNTHHHRSNRNIPLNETLTPFTYWLHKAGYTNILGNHSVKNKGRKIDVNFKHNPIGEWDGKTQFGLFDKYDTFEKEDEPFFAQIQLVVTHRGDWWDKVREESKTPIDPNTVQMPPYMADHPAVRMDWAKYLDQIEYMDNEVGLIFKELEVKGMADNTIVIFISDNGRCNIKGKGYLHDPGLRIPFLVYYPKRFKGGEVRKDVVSATDITATILDFAGVDIPKYMTGKPIFDKDFKRDYVYAARDLWDEIDEESRAIVSKRWKYIRNDKPEVPFDANQAYLEFYRPAVHIMRALNKQGKLNKEQAFFFNSEKPIEELYNLQTDPFELVNLANNPQYKSILTKFREEIKVFDKEMKPINKVYEPTSVEQTVKLVEWIKEEHPKVHEQMKNGMEIGFKKWTKKYKALRNK
ncbi:sulfatase family protein [Aquimarina aggregata]|uniref:sulfatase family protein n=1 Tax=Aquimarina aggregata TaxID=1642818 RepID=UPI0024906B04|nr:sulfatase [Aquimarina aggregata]